MSKRTDNEIFLENVISVEVVPDTGQLYMQFWHSFTLDNSATLQKKDIVAELGEPTENYIYYYRQFVASCLQRRYEAFQAWAQEMNQSNNVYQDEYDDEIPDLYNSLKSIN